MQEHIWEKEYRDPKLVTKHDEPQQAVKDFFKFLKKWHKKAKVTLPEVLKVLDLGSGTGRNSNYFAELGHEVVGIEIAPTALKIAEVRASELGLKNVKYIKGSIGEAFALDADSFDVALDVTSSNSLNEKEREVYVKETARVLEPGGFLFVRALCKDGDANAKNLIKSNPGPEKDTYVMPEFGLTERVFSKEHFVAIYSPFFEIIELEKLSHYSKFDGRIYKRNYWIAYLQKK
jgi:SAM-dependent methyltransferase